METIVIVIQMRILKSGVTKIRLYNRNIYIFWHDLCIHRSVLNGKVGPPSLRPNVTISLGSESIRSSFLAIAA